MATMTRRKAKWVVVVAAMVLGLAAVPAVYVLQAGKRGEHFYRGFPSSYWEGRLKSWANNPVGQFHSVPLLNRVVAYFGLSGRPAILDAHDSSAVPVLLDLYKSKDDRVRHQAIDALIRSPFNAAAAATLAADLNDPSIEVRRGAALVLCYLNQEWAPLLPAVVDAIRRGQIGEQTGFTPLWHLGPGDIPFLAQCLADRDTRIRLAVASALGNIGPAATVAVPALRNALQDEDKEVREAASWALTRVTPP
jgi:hypothetical protein